MRVEVAARTDRGRRRRSNEDRAVYSSIEEPAGSERRTWVLAVADGVGGGPQGDIAAEMATGAISTRLASASGDSESRLRWLYLEANRAVRGSDVPESSTPGRATTLVAALLKDDTTHVANIGDSRAYLLRDHRLTQVTRDHSWVSEEVAAGRLSARQATNHARRNIITKSLGKRTPIDPDIFDVGPLADGDTILLCSDGLYTMVDDDKIAAILESGDVVSATRGLVDVANERGGLDNIAVVVARASRANSR